MAMRRGQPDLRLGAAQIRETLYWQGGTFGVCCLRALPVRSNVKLCLFVALLDGKTSALLSLCNTFALLNAGIGACLPTSDVMCPFPSFSRHHYARKT